MTKIEFDKIKNQPLIKSMNQIQECPKYPKKAKRTEWKRVAPNKKIELYNEEL